ncbi:MAG: energy transducer TonB [Thiotrichaceae bacterium]|nr:energy transducer TonB [Thiotrichaceae bacterium]
MSTVTYQALALSWHPQNNNDKPFAIFLALVLALFIGLGIFLSSVEVPQTNHRTTVEVPQRIAKFIMDKPKLAAKLPAPKKEVTIKEKPTPKVKPKEAPKPKQPTVKRKKPEHPLKLSQKESTARETAAKSGLIALSNELSDLIDTSSIDAMMAKSLKKMAKPAQIATVNTALITSGSAQQTAHADIDANLPNVSSNTTLDTQQRKVAALALLTARAEEPVVASKQTKSAKEQPRVGNQRSEEEIAYVIDQNKSKLHAIYRSARRNNPGIMGMIVLEITILPSGKVAEILVKSSELNNARLEARLISRIKQFDFGSRNVNKITVTYPIEFLPS